MCGSGDIHKILVIDDEETVLDSISLLLNPIIDSNKYELEFCSNGEEALDLLQSYSEKDICPALIICDYLIPGLNGDALLALIHEKYPKALKIMLTGQDDLKAVTTAINSAGLYRYISKPCEKNEFILTIIEAIRQFENRLEIETNRQILEFQNNELYKKNEELIRQQKRLATSMKLSSIYWWEWNYPDKKVYLDSNLKQLLGIPENINDNESEFFERWHPEDIYLIQEALQELISKENHSARIEFRLLNSENEFIWMDIIAELIEKDEKNNPVLISGTCHNINRRKRRELISEAKEKRYKLLYETTPLGIVSGELILDENGNVKDLQVKELNPKAVEIFAIDEERILEETIFEYYEYRDIQLLEILNMIYNSDSIFSFESDISLFKKYFRIAAQNLKNDKNEIVLYVEDLTNQREVERQIQLAREKAEDNDRMKTEFLSNISHEIRTPINQVVGYAQLLKDDTLKTNDRLDFIQIITRNSEQLLELVNNIIDISKIAANELKLVYTDFSVNSVINEVANKYRNLCKFWFPDKNLDIRAVKSLPDNHAVLHTDESRFSQILGIFADNSIKFTHEGNVEIGYEIDIDKMKIYVKDTGIGIHKEHQSKIFECFRQLDGSHTRKYEGIGIGLSLAKSLSKVLGSNIDIESEIDVGTKITLEMNYTPPKTDQTFDCYCSTEKDSDEDFLIKLQNEKILVVDDNHEILQFFKTVFDMYSIQSVCASSATDAFEIFSQNQDIKIILMDINMPKISGIEAMKDFKDAYPDLYIIAQTAFAKFGDEQRFIELGFNDYINKPIEIELLMSKIAKAAENVYR